MSTRTIERAVRRGSAPTCHITIDGKYIGNDGSPPPSAEVIAQSIIDSRKKTSRADKLARLTKLERKYGLTD